MHKVYKRLRPLLGTFVEIAVVGEGFQKELAVNEAFKVIEKVHHLLSFHDPRSDLSILNQSFGKEVTIHPLSARVLHLAKLMTRTSGGLFNFSVGGKLIELGVLPRHSNQPFLQSGDWTDLVIKGQKVQLKRPVQITLDGIAKGYAVDLAVFLLKRQGMKSGWVNAGGDLRIFGHVSLPVLIRKISGQIEPIGSFENTALASSESSLSVEERFPGKIISVNAGALREGSWTVKSRFAWKADALTKVAALSPQAVGADTIKRLGGELILERSYSS